MSREAPISTAWPGRPNPLGATWDGEGVNFAVFSEHAEGVELAIFDASGRRERQRIVLRERTEHVWHAYLPEALRGTYAAMASAPVIGHFKRLGVTSLELMPVHAAITDRHLADKGLQNYWGYNTLGFFAPEMRYCASQQVEEFKTMVKTLHRAGLEVLLDVVYNH